MTAREPVHLSIGEVLAELSDEFPDITISKIRFLESQGLVNPERTPSGYRKFYPADLTRLRWILYQQKEHFLPLKVIKERLDELPPGGEDRLFDTVDAHRGQRWRDGRSCRDRGRRRAGSGARSRAGAPRVAPCAHSTRTRVRTHAAGRRRRRRAARCARGRRPLHARRARRRRRRRRGPGRGARELRPGHRRGELNGEAEYDDDALEIVRITAGFFARGVEGRHLRMYRTSAEREAVLFGQVLLPYVRQRNPEARARLQDELGELASLGRQLRTALLREAVRETLAE